MDNIITLSEQTASVQYLSNCDDRLRIAINLVGEITYTPHESSFSFFLDTIIGQMLSNKVADIISNRFHTLCNDLVVPEIVFYLKLEQLREIGLSKQKAEYILGIARVMLETPNYFEQLIEMSDDEVIKTLTVLRGIGNWSAKMYLIFVLDRQDVLPFEDGAFLQAYSWLYNQVTPTAIDIKEYGKRWKPYSSIAARYLYQLLDLGFTKSENIYSAFTVENSANKASPVLRKS